jgi:hypothetical protein
VRVDQKSVKRGDIKGVSKTNIFHAEMWYIHSSYLRRSSRVSIDCGDVASQPSSREVCSNPQSLNALKYRSLMESRKNKVGIKATAARTDGPSDFFSPIIIASKSCPTNIPLIHISNKKGKRIPPASNLGGGGVEGAIVSSAAVTSTYNLHP